MAAAIRIFRTRLILCRNSSGWESDRCLKWTPVSSQTTTKPAHQYDNGANFLHGRPRMVSVRRRVKREDVERVEQVGVVGIKIKGQMVTVR